MTIIAWQVPQITAEDRALAERITDQLQTRGLLPRVSSSGMLNVTARQSADALLAAIQSVWNDLESAEERRQWAETLAEELEADQDRWTAIEEHVGALAEALAGLRVQMIEVVVGSPGQRHGSAAHLALTWR